MIRWPVLVRIVLVGIVVLVALIWATSLVFSFVDPTRAVDPGVNAIFASVVGVAAALAKPRDREPRP